MNQPVITPGQGGYLAEPTQKNYGANPWVGLHGEDMRANLAGQKQGAQNIQALQQQMGNYGESSYPTMPNDYGLGQTSNQPIPGSASSPDYQTSPLNVTVPDSSSRGFNPWSLTGESNARGK